MNHSVSTIGNIFRNKNKQALRHLTRTVYKLQCSCGKTYIGQSKRNLKTRLEEHDPTTFGKSDVADHLRKNPDHTIDFHNPLILAQETCWRKLRIEETLYIIHILKSCSHNWTQMKLHIHYTILMCKFCYIFVPSYYLTNLTRANFDPKVCNSYCFLLS